MAQQVAQCALSNMLNFMVSGVHIKVCIFVILQRFLRLCYTVLIIRDAPVDRPKIGTGRFFAYNARSATGRFLSFFRPIFPKVRTCHLCGRHSAGAQQTQKNRYNEANSRWCNITGTQIRAAFLCCSSWSCLWWVGLDRFIYFERIFNETREERVVSGSDSFSRACAPS